MDTLDGFAADVVRAFNKAARGQREVIDFSLRIHLIHTIIRDWPTITNIELCIQSALGSLLKFSQGNRTNAVPAHSQDGDTGEEFAF
jgi:hypothetical protein